MKKILLTLTIAITASGILKAQVLILTFSALTKSSDKALVSKLKGDWMVTSAQIDGHNRLAEFEGVLITFPKCKGEDFKSGKCRIEVAGDDNTDYFKDLLGEDQDFSTTSHKQINKEANAEDAGYEKVKYEKVTTGGTELEYAFKYKKGIVKIETLSEGVTESFELQRPPKEKK